MIVVEDIDVQKEIDERRQLKSPVPGSSISEYLILRDLFVGILEETLHGSVPEPLETRTFQSGITDMHRRWLTLLDLGASPEVLRIGVQKRSPDDDSLIVLLRYFARLRRPMDEDRFDWVITYLFKKQLSPDEQADMAEVSGRIADIFPDLPRPPLSDSAKAVLRRLHEMLEELPTFATFSDLTKSPIIARGRELKASLREERYQPTVLAAVITYNLALGKAFRGLFADAAACSRELAAQVKYSVGTSAIALELDEREEQKIRNMLRSIESVKHSVVLAEWEAAAFENQRADSEFSRMVRQAVAFLVRVEEEREQLELKTGSEYLWKPHYDALIWLFARGREQAEKMRAFSRKLDECGLPEKREQMWSTAARLKASLDRAAKHL